MQDAPEMTREQAALLARCLQPGAGGELQRRIARGEALDKFDLCHLIIIRA